MKRFLDYLAYAAESLGFVKPLRLFPNRAKQRYGKSFLSRTEKKKRPRFRTMWKKNKQ